MSAAETKLFRIRINPKFAHRTVLIAVACRWRMVNSALFTDMSRTAQLKTHFIGFGVTQRWHHLLGQMSLPFMKPNSVVCSSFVELFIDRPMLQPTEQSTNLCE